MFDHCLSELYNQIEENNFRNLLTILQSQLKILLDNFKVSEQRNEIYRYVYFVRFSYVE